MHINGIELNPAKRCILLEGVHHQLDQWQSCVGRARDDVTATFYRQQVKECEALLRILRSEETCNATDAAGIGS